MPGLPGAVWLHGLPKDNSNSPNLGDESYVVTLTIAYCRAQPLDILEPKGPLIVRLASSAHNTVWWHPLTHHLLSDNLWYLSLGPEFFPLYSATIVSLAKCLTFSKVVLQGSWQKISAPKKCRPFMLGVASQCILSGVAFLDLLRLWTVGLCACWSVFELCVCVILSPLSCVSFYSSYGNSHLPDVRSLEGIWVKK